MKERKRTVALFIDAATDTEHYVRAPGYKLQPGDKKYDPQIHDGNLIALDNRRPVKLAEEKSSQGGSSAPGLTAGFILVAEPPVVNDHPKTPRHNKNKGYLIKIDTAEYSPVLNQREGAYSISEGGRQTFNDADLRDREPVSIKRIQDFPDLIRKADPARLRNSVILFQNNTQTWDETFIRLGTPSRLRNMLDNLRKHEAGTEPLFCVIELKTTDHHDPFLHVKPMYTRKGQLAADHTRLQVTRAPIEPIKIGMDAHGFPEYLSLDLYIDNDNDGQAIDEETRFSLAKPGKYLVMGEIRYRRSKHEASTVNYLKIKVTDSCQVMEIDMQKLALEARKSARTYAPKAFTHKTLTV